MKCIRCRKILDYAMPIEEDHKPAMSDAIDSGGTIQIAMGYGSIYDCQQAMAYICDTCFEECKHVCVNHYDGLA